MMCFSNIETAWSYIHCCRLAMEEIQQIYKMYGHYKYFSCTGKAELS